MRLSTILRILLIEKIHRELFDHYYVHHSVVHKDLRIIPKWKAWIYELILTKYYKWRLDFHDLADYIAKKAQRYVDNRIF